MFIQNSIFWMIISLGIAIPSTVILIINFIIKAVSGERYEMHLTKVAKIYSIALLGWAIFFGVVL